MMILFMASALGIGFWLGIQSAEQRISSLNGRLNEALDEKTAADDSITQVRAEAQTAIMRYNQLKETYEDIIPNGPMEELVFLVREQLEGGMDPNRLAFLIRSARPPQNCIEPDTKRFIVSTPAYKGADSKISIAEGAITITGTGDSVKNEAGAPEAWYDSSKEVQIVFTLEDGQQDIKKGVMPLQHSVVADAREYRFTIREGARSFAKITYDSCDYP